MLSTPPGVDYFGEGINGCTGVMQSSSNELSASVSSSIKCKQMEVNTYTLNSQPCVGSTAGYEVMLSVLRKVRLVLIPTLRV